MKLDIVEKKKNPLLNREEVLINLAHEGKATPPRDEIVSLCQKELKVPKETIIIDRVFTKRGQAVSEIRALLYKKKEDIPQGKLEKMKRSEKKKEKGREEEKKEESKEEKQKEEVKEKPKETEVEKQKEDKKAEEKVEETEKKPEVKEEAEEKPKEEKESETEEKPEKKE